MGLLDRSPRSPFPNDMLRWLEDFGRCSLDVHGSGLDSGAMWDRFGPLLGYARSDQDGFLAALGAVVAGDQGGFATFGAARVVWEMYGDETLHIPAALPLIDAGIEFVLARGLPTAMLTGYEMQRLVQLREQTG